MIETGIPRVALVTCAEIPLADPDTRSLIPMLEVRGIDASPQVWDDPIVDWSSFDLAIVRSCWDYHTRRDEFLAWAAKVPRLVNESHVLEWNTDKRYLMELDRNGIPVVPTTWLPPSAEWTLEPFAELQEMWVVKPAVSLACLATGRYDLSNDRERALACAHIRRLHNGGLTAMLQPYAANIETWGETSMVFLGGEFSHAMRKGPMLDGPDRQIDRRFVPQGGIDLTPRQPTSDELDVARRALRIVPGGQRLLYARVDIVPGPSGRPKVLEVELTEPQLYLRMVSSAAERLADLIAARCGSTVADTL